MPDHIISRLRRFHTRYFLRLRNRFRDLLDQGPHPRCSIKTVTWQRTADDRLAKYFPNERFENGAPVET